MGGNWVIVFYWSQAEKGKGKRERKRGRRGKGIAVREEIWGARTQTVRTWHWPRERNCRRHWERIYSLGGKGGEERAGEEERVPAEVDGRGPGFLPRWEPRAGAMALKTARSSCAPGSASPRGGLAGVGKVWAKRGQLVAPECTRRSWKWDQSCSFIREGWEEPATRDFFFLPLSFHVLFCIFFPYYSFFICLTNTSSSPSLHPPHLK